MPCVDTRHRWSGSGPPQAQAQAQCPKPLLWKNWMQNETMKCRGIPRGSDGAPSIVRDLMWPLTTCFRCAHTSFGAPAEEGCREASRGPGSLSVLRQPHRPQPWPGRPAGSPLDRAKTSRGGLLGLAAVSSPGESVGKWVTSLVVCLKTRYVVTQTVSLVTMCPVPPASQDHLTGKTSVPSL